MTSVGILGIGMHLPSEVRRNDWWPASVVDGWLSQRKAAPPGPKPVPATDGEARVLAALATQAVDPFQGSVARHVIADDESVYDLGERAARMAIERAGIAIGDIDLLLTHTVVPDYLLSNPACILHQRLGLPRVCFALETDVATYSVMMQLSLAEAMIASGKARYALLVQSCAATRLVERDQAISPLFGDGATAIVVGPVTGRGLRGEIHHADGNYPDSLIASVPGKRWWEAGRDIIHIANPPLMQSVLLQTVDVIKTSVTAALAAAKHEAEAVDFLCMHQGTPWLRRVVQDYTGMQRARSVETFSRFGYLFGAILPSALFVAEQEGQLSAGDTVVMTGGGTGMTYGAIVLDWGR